MLRSFLSKTTASIRPLASRRFLSSSGGAAAQLQTLKAESPHTNVVHYTHKNQTFTVQQVDYFSTALAIGLAENGLTNGDRVLSWLPSHFAETVRVAVLSILVW